MPLPQKKSLVLFNQTEILSAANTLFCAKGLIPTTMDDIAKAANCSKSTLYIYFKSKDDIFHHLLYEEMGKLHATLQVLTSLHLDFEHFFLRVCHYFVTLHDQSPVYFDGLAGHIQIHNQNFSHSDILEKTYIRGEKINDLIMAPITQAMAKGILRPDIEPIETVFILWASLHGIIATASAKTPYIAMRMNKTREAFMQYGFDMLLQSLINPTS